MNRTPALALILLVVFAATVGANPPATPDARDTAVPASTFEVGG